MLQMEFVTELFEIAKLHQVHTALDTSGNPFLMEDQYQKKFNKLMEVTDLFIVDIKEMDSKRHKDLTGHGNQNILTMIEYLSIHKKPMWIRHVLVPGLTDSEESLKDLKKFLDSLQSVEKVEILPYHAMGVHKWEALEIPYSLNDTIPPTKQEIERAKQILNI